MSDSENALSPDLEPVDDNEVEKPVNDDEAAADASDDDDLESLLSEVDEAQFDDFDPTTGALADRQAIPVDESNVRLLGVHKRKRGEGGEDGEVRRKKKREGKREKPTRSRQRRDGSEPFSGGEEIQGKRNRKAGEGSGRKKASQQVDEESLTPEERRKRALDRAMDEALRNPNARRRKVAGIDLEAMADAEIEEMRARMTTAAESDTRSRANGQPAMHKLKMLPDVVSLLNRKQLANQIVDPDINLLQGVKFFLEPLNDGSLPAYNIQRELFNALMRLPITKESLVASGIGKVVLFYTRSSKVEAVIKRQAEKLITDWMRPILGRTDDYRRRGPDTSDAGRAQMTDVQRRVEAARQRALEMPMHLNRARMPTGASQSYTIAPKSTAGQAQKVKQPGQAGHAGDVMIRKLKTQQIAKR